MRQNRIQVVLHPLLGGACRSTSYGRIACRRNRVALESNCPHDRYICARVSRAVTASPLPSLPFGRFSQCHLDPGVRGCPSCVDHGKRQRRPSQATSSGSFSRIRRLLASTHAGVSDGVFELQNVRGSSRASHGTARSRAAREHPVRQRQEPGVLQRSFLPFAHNLSAAPYDRVVTVTVAVHPWDVREADEKTGR